MCTSEPVKTQGWSKTPPAQNCDCLWINQFSCGCVIQSGICWVHTAEEGYVDDEMYSYEANGQRFYISWESREDLRPPFHEGKPCVDWWMPVELPPGED